MSAHFHELRHEGYLITDNRSRLDRDVIHRYLAEESYWAKGVAREQVDRSLDHSLCLSVYSPDGNQVGLARAITDQATFAWLCDVFILAHHRGHGLGKALLQAVMSHPQLRTVRRIGLATNDAHGLYAQLGFTPISNPEKQMEKRFLANNPSGAT